ncbi:MAG TPA: 30S ribosomal protein S14 [Planctomycetes bacterium]|nr:30S ribosomal protein S14 [Planctomycetota bacterium]
MAKTSVKNRQIRRKGLVAQHAEKRRELTAILKNAGASLEEKYAAYQKLASLPRDSSAVRLHNRCQVTGRPRGYYRKFGISRLVFRRLAHKGELPGVRKSSW